jgi:FKBP-type peptidyl-prolyl cis-trans isomerase FkpA
MLTHAPNLKSTTAALLISLSFVGFASKALAQPAPEAQPSPAATAVEKKASKPTPKNNTEKNTGKNSEKKTEKKTGKKSETRPVAIDTSGVVLPKDVKKLIVEDTIVGQGKAASKGKKIKINFTGWLYDPNQPMGRGKQFTTSAGRDPFEFQLGGGIVIRGWDEGFENMKVGGKRKLIIPAELAYGDRGAGTEIPPHSALMFEVELLEVY